MQAAVDVDYAIKDAPAAAQATVELRNVARRLSIASAGARQSRSPMCR